MKRLFLFLFAAILGISQMWGLSYTIKMYVVLIDGSTYSVEKSNNSRITSENTSFTWNSSGYYTITTNSNTADVTVTAVDKSDYVFKGWYDGQYSSSKLKYSTKSITECRSDYNSGSWYAHFEKVSSGSGTGGSTGGTTGSVTSVTAAAKSAQSVTVNFSGSNSGKTINYALPSDVVDMGTAGYWRNANVGTDSPNSPGTDYCQWGQTKQSYSNSYSLPTTADLVSTNDIATVKCGTGYCIPSKDDWQKLLNTSNYTWVKETDSWNGHYVVTCKSNGNSIVLPITGKYENSTKGSSACGCYWTRTYNSGNPYCAQFYTSGSTFTTSLYGMTSGSNCTGSLPIYASLFVRPYYNMTGTIYTLTVNVVTPTQTYVYKYRGASGQVVNVTASAQSGYNVTWSDNSNDATSTRQFSLTSDMTKTINYTANVSYVTATFYNYDGTTQLYQNTQVVSGTTPTYGGSTPTKPKDDTYTYTHNGWSPALGNITTNTEYTAQFTPVYRNYTVTFRSSVSDPNPSVKSDYHFGDEITNKPTDDPIEVLEEDADYYSVFDGWYIVNKDIVFEDGMTVTGDMIFEPRYIHTNYDTDTITVNVTAGEGKVTLTYAGQTYTMNTDEGNSKQFIIRNATGRLTAVAAPARGYHVEGAASKLLQSLRTTEISFTFAANTPLDLIENQKNLDYTNQLYAAHANEYLTVTVKTDNDTKRAITNTYWATICLPFDYTITSEDAFFDQVYALATANVDNNNIATLNFVRQTRLTAYVPYLITARRQIDELVFDGVKLTQYDNRSLQIKEGNVDFIGTLATTTVKNTAGDKSNFYIANSASGVSLKFANTTSGVTIYGYRAYFHKNASAPASAPARRAIVDLDGEQYEMVITEDGDIVPANQARKYIQNGQLIIERDGVKYNALGATAE